MTIKALRLDATRDYESLYDEDRGTPEATVWKLGTLDSRTSGRIKDLATRFNVDPNAPEEEVSTVINTSEVNYQRVQFGLRGVERFRDEKGNDIPFKTVARRHGGKSYEVVSDAFMALIPTSIIEELANEIVKDNELTPAKAKNSGTP